MSVKLQVIKIMIIIIVIKNKHMKHTIVEGVAGRSNGSRNSFLNSYGDSLYHLCNNNNSNNIIILGRKMTIVSISTYICI